MKSGSRSNSHGSLLWLFVAGCVALTALALGCNEHNFNPIPEMQVYPDAIAYDNQRKDEFTKEVIISNSSIAARLNVYELGFVTTSGITFSQEQVTPADQTVTLAGSRLPKEITNGSGTKVTVEYLEFARGIIAENVPCTSDSYCSEKMGNAYFTCMKHPLMPNLRDKICVAHYKFLNNVGRMVDDPDEANPLGRIGIWKNYVWGGNPKMACTAGNVNQCTELCIKTYGNQYKYNMTDGVCYADIKLRFAVDYGLDQLALVDQANVDTSKAAVWRGVDAAQAEPTQKLCDSLGTEVAYYGLNSCDQLAIKERLYALTDKSGDDEDTSGFQLFPSRQANYQVMISTAEGGMVDQVRFCDAENTPATATTLLLHDPDFCGAGLCDHDCTENKDCRDVSPRAICDPVAKKCLSCVDAKGDIKPSMLSVDPTKIKLQKLPVRLLYSPAAKEDYEAQAELESKNFTMKVTGSALIGQDSYDRLVAISLPGNPGCPPTPSLKLAQGSENPEPLDKIVITAEDSESPFGDSREPLSFYWEWAENGKPQYAEDSVLISASDVGGFEDPRPFTGQWFPREGDPKLPVADRLIGEKAKLYVPIAGTYRVKVKVRDSKGNVSGPTEECPNSPEWAELPIVVRPSQKLHVEMMWDYGDMTDVDLYLVRYRDNGTFSVGFALYDAIKAEPVSMPTCNDPADCFEGKLACTSGFCVNSCTSDADCKALRPGWICNEFNQCANEPGNTVGCEKDSDCPSNSYCNPANIMLDDNQTEYRMICTMHNSDAINDTCYYSNPGNTNEATDNSGPRWGGYHDLNTACTSDDVCDPFDNTSFTCDGTDCDYACSASSECLKASNQYLCGDSGQCIGNDTSDDPSHDKDDTEGWGPENISLKEPNTNRYRIVTRFYDDQTRAVESNNNTPRAPLNMIVQVYLSGEKALEQGIIHEASEVMTYWKVADVYWDAEANSGNGSGRVVPLCAGWTKAKCQNNSDCATWYHVCDTEDECNSKCGADATCKTKCLSDADECKAKYDYQFTCEKREWGKWCSTCNTETGTPEDCTPINTITCASDEDCAGEPNAKFCRPIENKYCRCAGANEFGDLKTSPYANPFLYKTGGVLDPSSALGKYSIWCDNPTDKYNATQTCSQLYGQ